MSILQKSTKFCVTMIWKKTSNFVRYLRSRSLGKYELLRSPSVGVSALGSSGCLPAARYQKSGA